MNSDVEKESAARTDADGDGRHAQTTSPAEAFKLTSKAFAEFREYAFHYLAAKAAITKLTLRRVAVLTGIVAVGFLVVGAMLVSATVLLLTGAANALGSAFTPPKPWIGQIVIGLVFIGGTALWTILVLKKYTHASRRKTIAEFEQRRRDEKSKFGRDIVDRATAANLDAS